MDVKEPKTFEQQIEILKSRNLVINNVEEAKIFLSNVNYYRFTSYLIDYKVDRVNYKTGTSIDEIKAIYYFDTELKSIIFKILETIEISFRTYIAYTLGNNYGALGYMDSSHFYNTKYHSEFITDLKKNINWNKDKAFIKHHIDNYKNKFPIWVAVEVFNFGLLSKLYSNMGVKDKKYIANEFIKKYEKNGKLTEVNYRVVSDWLHKLSFLRNDCAHYNRLYTNRLKPISILNIYTANKYDDCTLFSYLLATKHLFYENSTWKKNISELEELIESYKEVIDLDKLGFPKNWFEVLSK